MTEEQIYNAAKEWCDKYLIGLPNQEVDDVAMVWQAAIRWYKQQNKNNE